MDNKKYESPEIVELENEVSDTSAFFNICGGGCA